jgi:hypothetical protein
MREWRMGWGVLPHLLVTGVKERMHLLVVNGRVDGQATLLHKEPPVCFLEGRVSLMDIVPESLVRPLRTYG